MVVNIFDSLMIGFLSKHTIIWSALTINLKDFKYWDILENNNYEKK